MVSKINFKTQESFLGVYDYNLADKFFEFITINRPFLGGKKNYILSSKNAKVLGRSNIILNSNNVASLDSLVFSFQKDKIFGIEHSDFILDNQTKPVFNYVLEKNIDSAVFIGSNPNIGHWIFNHVLKIAFLNEEQKNLKFLVSDNNIPKRYLDFFNLLRFRNEIIFLQKSVLYNIDNIILPMMPWHTSASGFVSFCPNIITYLRKFTIKNKNKEDTNIFISRKRALRRNLLNEAELVNYLKKKNFQIIFLEDLTLDRQIEIGNQAKNVICPWGASSNFLFFMNDNTNFIDLCPRKMMNVIPMFCKYSKVNYYPISGRLSDESDPLDSDFLIDLNELKKFFP